MEAATKQKQVAREITQRHGISASQALQIAQGTIKHQEEHRLIIHSLHDAEAKCSCGRWSFIGAGPRTREYIQNEFRFHVAPLAALQDGCTTTQNDL